MQNTLKNFIKNLKIYARTFYIIGMVTKLSHAADGIMPIDNSIIKLSDGRSILAERCGIHCHCLSIKRGKNTLDKQCYEQEFDRLWDYTFFVPVKLNEYISDINGDGIPEIGVATWDGGNNIAERYALAFSVKGNKLVYFDKVKFNLEYGKFMYK